MTMHTVLCVTFSDRELREGNALAGKRVTAAPMRCMCKHQTLSCPAESCLFVEQSQLVKMQDSVGDGIPRTRRKSGKAFVLMNTLPGRGF